MPSDLSWPFVLESIDSVIEIAKTIRNNDKAAAPFCRTLRNILRIIKDDLKHQSQAQDEAQKKKMESLLNNLERLCNWPRSARSEKNQWPTLTALKHASNTQNATTRLRNFATDNRSHQSRADIVAKLSVFSSRNLKKETAFIAQNGRDWTSSRLHPVNHKLDHDDVQHLYNTLKQYRSCEKEGSQGEIIANIRLNGYKSLVEGNAGAQFGVLFLDHPHAGQCHWQEACIQIRHKKSSSVASIKLATDVSQSLTSNLTAAPNNHELIPCESFCQHISGRRQDLLWLSTQNKQFIHHRQSTMTRSWLASREAVQLGSLITKPELNLYDKSKRIFGMLIAKATWQFYDSDIIGQGLTSDSVYFLCEQRDAINGVFIDEPMLVPAFVENASQKASASLIHDMPKILALGILLLELETRKPMRVHRENTRLFQPGHVNINTDYLIAKNLTDTGPNAHSASIMLDIDPLSPLKTVLPLCINSGELQNRFLQNLSAQKKNSIRSEINEQNLLRCVIYNEIVEPLETWARHYDDHDKVKPLYEVENVLVRPTRAPAPITYQPVPHRGPTGPEDLELRKESIQWFSNYDKLKHVLQSPYEDTQGGYDRVKIAVLDTGIREGDYEYYMDCKNISGYSDFVNRTPEATPCDNNGHGTAAISLLVAMHPAASLYIARVLENDIATLSNIVNVVEAIDWAIEKNVDIITMAIGFQDEQKLVSTAIKRAHNNGILIFSAASNRRNADGVYCPANLTEQVFGIFSTNAGNRESSSLNPSPFPGREDSFAIFGENIELPDNIKLGKQVRPLLKGSSYSTSIAAGLAAALLDFARQETDAIEAPDLSELKERARMKRVFREMVVSDNGYSCIQPWKLLSWELKLKYDGEELRRQQRRYIRTSIARVLPRDKLHELQPR